MPTARLTGEARRAAILDAAVRLFSEKGFRGVTTRELAAAVGVTEPVLYQHFETKSDLYRAIIEERILYGDRAIPNDFCELTGASTDDRDFLIQLAHGIVHWHTDDPTYIRLLLFSALEHHELNQMFVEKCAGAFLGGLAKFFERRISEGAFRKMDPMFAAHAFTALAGQHGMSHAIFQHGIPQLPEEQVLESFVDIFLEGIRQRP